MRNMAILVGVSLRLKSCQNTLGAGPGMAPMTVGRTKVMVIFKQIDKVGSWDTIVRKIHLFSKLEDV